MLTYPLTLLSKPVNPNCKIRLQIYKKLIYHSPSTINQKPSTRFGRIPRYDVSPWGSRRALARVGLVVYPEHGRRAAIFLSFTLMSKKTLPTKTKRISTTIPYAAAQKFTLFNNFWISTKIEVFRNLNKTHISKFICIKLKICIICQIRERF